MNQNSVVHNRLEKTVRAICPIVQNSISSKAKWNEYLLRREMVACILGSQVRYEMARTALNNIEQAGLLSDYWWSNTEDKFELYLFEVLSGQSTSQCSNWRYRFPKIRAHQLAKARDAVLRKPLSERLLCNPDPKDIRKRLVKDISGLGPKQASMFLRNIGLSYDIAVLDVHVIRFMHLQNLLNNKEYNNISTLNAYEQTEQIFINYSNLIGFQAGCLDLAIWVSMRAARELGL